MKQLIDDLLTYSNIHKEPLNYRLVNLKDLIESVLRSLDHAIKEAHGEITWDPLPTVYGDAVQLLQLFQNLISNAIKFKGENPPRIHISVSYENNRWLFGVKDNGIGIKSEFFERIFFIFERLHSRKTYMGTGIGLAICKRVVENHGGHIWVESDPGKGSTFFVSLPNKNEGS
jgi:light-regulated signal transduction histidine kinase (bacteriophytochrome)